MKFPIYSESDIKSLDEVNITTQEFIEFICQLMEQDHWEYPAENGVVTLVHSKGTSILTTKQANVLNIIVKRYDARECKICGNSIPMSEVLYHEMNKGLCSYHKHQLDKDFD